jgi:hypothetical protein
MQLTRNIGLSIGVLAALIAVVFIGGSQYKT